VEHAIGIGGAKVSLYQCPNTHVGLVFCFPAKFFPSEVQVSIKETLRRKFADVANSFEQRLRGISSEIVNLDGPLEVGSLILSERQLHRYHSARFSNRRSKVLARN
jgi:hypothetical protein